MARLTVAVKWNGRVLSTKVHSVSSVRSLERLIAKYNESAEETGGYPEIIGDATNEPISSQLCSIGVRPTDISDRYEFVRVGSITIQLHWDGAWPSAQ